MAQRQLEGPAVSKGSALRGNLQIDTYRGTLRVRAWPKKRGKPKTERQAFQQKWFGLVLALIKYMEPGFLEQMYRLTKRTSMYPRDLAMNMLSGRHAWFIFQDGRKVFPEAFYMAVTDSLDSITQKIGALLWRGPNGWAEVPPGEAGQVLEFTGPDTPPEWIDLPDAGGLDLYGATQINWGRTNAFSSGFFGGLQYTSPAAFLADAIVFRARAAAPTAKLTPAIYAINPGGTLGALIATGPTVTGALLGETLLPLAAPTAIGKGQAIAVGMVLQVAGVSAAGGQNLPVVSFATAGAPPNPAPAASFSQDTWGNFALRRYKP